MFLFLNNFSIVIQRVLSIYPMLNHNLLKFSTTSNKIQIKNINILANYSQKDYQWPITSPACFYNNHFVWLSTGSMMEIQLILEKNYLSMIKLEEEKSYLSYLNKKKYLSMNCLMNCLQLQEKIKLDRVNRWKLIEHLFPIWCQMRMNFSIVDLFKGKLINIVFMDKKITKNYLAIKCNKKILLHNL